MDIYNTANLQKHIVIRHCEGNAVAFKNALVASITPSLQKKWKLNVNEGHLKCNVKDCGASVKFRKSLLLHTVNVHIDLDAVSLQSVLYTIACTVDKGRTSPSMDVYLPSNRSQHDAPLEETVVSIRHAILTMMRELVYAQCATQRKLDALKDEGGKLMVEHLLQASISVGNEKDMSLQKKAMFEQVRSYEDDLLLLGQSVREKVNSLFDRYENVLQNK